VAARLRAGGRQGGLVQHLSLEAQAQHRLGIPYRFPVTLY
jgi:hypothetical protein